MPTTNYKKSEELLKNFKNERIGFMKLQSLIMREIGSDPRTISNTIRLMLDTRLIKDVGESHFKVK